MTGNEFFRSLCNVLKFKYFKIVRARNYRKYLDFNDTGSFMSLDFFDDMGNAFSLCINYLSGLWMRELCVFAKDTCSDDQIIENLFSEFKRMLSSGNFLTFIGHDYVPKEVFSDSKAISLDVSCPEELLMQIDLNS